MQCVLCMLAKSAFPGWPGVIDVLWRDGIAGPRYGIYISDMGARSGQGRGLQYIDQRTGRSSFPRVPANWTNFHVHTCITIPQNLNPGKWTDRACVASCDWLARQGGCNRL